MKEWGKAFQVPVKSAQVCMVSPGKGDVNSGAAVRVGNSSGRRGWHGAGGPAHSCLVGRRAQSYQSFSFFSREPET